MSASKALYERLRPMIVWLGLTELGWIAWWLLSPDSDPGFTVIVVAWIVAMLAWLGLMIAAGARGFFLEHSRAFSNLLGVVLVVAFAGLLFGALPVARQGLLAAAAATPNLQLVAIHTLRLLAIGTVVKYLQRELPLHFVLLGSLPDFLFAVSAVVLTVQMAGGGSEPGWLISWHAIGFSLFLGAGISMFLSVPSPIRIYHGQPDASIVFRFPMQLAPTFTVPLFMIAHGVALVKLMAP